VGRLGEIKAFGERNKLLFLFVSVFVNNMISFCFDIIKLSLRVFLGNNTVAMVTYCVMKMVTTCLPMLGQFFDTMTVASSDKEWL